MMIDFSSMELLTIVQEMERQVVELEGRLADPNTDAEDRDFYTSLIAEYLGIRTKVKLTLGH